MSYNRRLKQEVIDQAKSANLIDYMLLNHPDQIINRYGIRDKVHDSLVLYPHTFCRYSTGEVNDNIEYLVKYQNYRWRDAVLRLRAFSSSRYESTLPPSFYSSYGKQHRRFFPPIATEHIDLITDYLHAKRAISLETIHKLLSSGLIYPATASGYGEDYVCFSNKPDNFFSLRNVSSEGMEKLIFTKEPDNFWWFSSLHLKSECSLLEYLSLKQNQYPDDFPVYICEAPIDAISLYELQRSPGIYTAMAGLKANTVLNIVHRFSIDKPEQTPRERKIILAVDNDDAGKKFVSAFENHYEYITPSGKDWNENLISLRNRDGLS